MVAGLRNVAKELAQGVADGLGIELPEALPKLVKRSPKPEVRTSAALSLLARPGQTGILTRRIAILVADGVAGRSVMAVHQALADQGAVPRIVGTKLGQVSSADSDPIEVEVSMETGPSVLYDALVLPDGEEGVTALSQSGHAMEFLKDQYRHCKPILVLGAGNALLEIAGIAALLSPGKTDGGILRFDGVDTDAALEAFAQAIMKHRIFERETDSPINLAIATRPSGQLP